MLSILPILETGTLFYFYVCIYINIYPSHVKPRTYTNQFRAADLRAEQCYFISLSSMLKSRHIYRLHNCNVQSFEVFIHVPEM